MSPPTVIAYSSGGSVSAEVTSQTQRRIAAAHKLLTGTGYYMSPSKVSRLVRQFETRLESAGADFFDFLANKVQLTTEQRIRALANPDIARVIAYADPTGESAVNNVIRGN
jgi:hypothetical protein